METKSKLPPNVVKPRPQSGSELYDNGYHVRSHAGPPLYHAWVLDTKDTRNRSADDESIIAPTLPFRSRQLKMEPSYHGH